MSPTSDERFREALIGILRDFLSSVRILLEQKERRVSEADARSDERAHYEEIAALRQIADRLQAISSQQDSEHQRNERRYWNRSLVIQGLLFIATTCAFGAAYWYARIADQQKNTMITQTSTATVTMQEIQKQTGFVERSAKGAESAASAAQEALKESRNQFRQDQRPYVWHSGIRSDNSVSGRLGVSVYWVNYGKSPALRLSTTGKMFCGKDALQNGYSFLDSAKTSLEWRRLQSVIAPFVPTNVVNPSSPYDGFVTDPMTPKDMADCDLSLPQIIVGMMEYYDLYGNRYMSEFCTGKRFMNSSRGYLADGNCPQHNRM